MSDSAEADGFPSAPFVQPEASEPAPKLRPDFKLAIDTTIAQTSAAASEAASEALREQLFARAAAEAEKGLLTEEEKDEIQAHIAALDSKARRAQLPYDGRMFPKGDDLEALGNFDDQMNKSPPYVNFATPIYSLVTMPGEAFFAQEKNGEEVRVPRTEGGRPTMNILTYASPVSIKPRRFAISLFKGTLSYDQFMVSGVAVIQALRLGHADLIELLGRTSGRKVDKIAELQKTGWDLTAAWGFPVLRDCLGCFELRAIPNGAYFDCGDHTVVICDVRRSWTSSCSATAPLTTGHLRELEALKGTPEATPPSELFPGLSSMLDPETLDPETPGDD